MGVFPCIYNDSGNHINVCMGTTKWCASQCVNTRGELWFPHNTSIRTDRVLSYKVVAAYKLVQDMTSYDDGLYGFCNVWWEWAYNTHK